MSDAKKTGSRDISELKQRLGLKKGGQSGSSSSLPRANGAPSGGVVPPPGLAVPPPPGVTQPTPMQGQPQPVIPNAADDPFAAMNAMAAVAQVQRAPEIVIVNDGKPVENVGAGGGGLAKLLIPAGIALVVGVAVGKIGAGAASYNDGLKGAKAILGDRNSTSSVTALKATLSQLDTLLDNARSTGFHPDKSLDKQLEDLAKKLDVKSDLVFRAKENTLDAQLSGQILSFYAGISEVKDMIDAHIRSALADDMALATAAKKGKDAQVQAADDAYLAGQFPYAVVMSAPTDQEKADFGARLVELGPPYCGDKVSTTGHCDNGEQPSGFAYRSEPGAMWTKGDVATNGQDSVPAKKIVLLLQDGVRDSLAKGAGGIASEQLYEKRLEALYERVHGKPGQDGKGVGGLLEDGNKLQTRLQTEANKGTRFSFFM